MRSTASSAGRAFEKGEAQLGADAVLGRIEQVVGVGLAREPLGVAVVRAPSRATRRGARRALRPRLARLRPCGVAVARDPRSSPAACTPSRAAPRARPSAGSRPACSRRAIASSTSRRRRRRIVARLAAARQLVAELLGGLERRAAVLGLDRDAVPLDRLVGGRAHRPRRGRTLRRPRPSCPTAARTSPRGSGSCRAALLDARPRVGSSPPKRSRIEIVSSASVERRRRRHAGELVARRRRRRAARRRPSRCQVQSGIAVALVRGPGVAAGVRAPGGTARGGDGVDEAAAAEQRVVERRREQLGRLVLDRPAGGDDAAHADRGSAPRRCSRRTRRGRRARSTDLRVAAGEVAAVQEHELGHRRASP